MRPTSVRLKLTNISLRGLQMHIGSQLTSLQPFLEAVEKVTPLAIRLKSAYGIEFFSIGGGVGIVYDPALESGKPEWWAAQEEEHKPLTIEQYAEGVMPVLKESGLKILLEPGRYIVGNAGVLLTRCLYEKKGSAKTFRIVDAGMNDLIRPALYEGHHEIVPLSEPAGSSSAVDVVGPVCETGDFFCQDRELPDFAPGDAIALLSAGAYGFVMASNYNSRGLPVEILVEGSEAKVIRPRQPWMIFWPARRRLCSKLADRSLKVCLSWCCMSGMKQTIRPLKTLTAALLFIVACSAHADHCAEHQTKKEQDQVVDAEVLFNGKDLQGWSGDPKFWSVRDGVIYGTTLEHKAQGNTFLVYQGEDTGDFHLSLEARCMGKNNSGVMYRSSLVEGNPFAMGGYQCDIHPKAAYTAMIYGERMGRRGIIITRGQKMVIDEERQEEHSLPGKA